MDERRLPCGERRKRPRCIANRGPPSVCQAAIRVALISLRRCVSVKTSLARVVTLPCSEREVSAPQELSGRLDRGTPRVHRRRAKPAVRLGRGEMALDVKGVVDGGVCGKKFLG